MNTHDFVNKTACLIFLLYLLWLLPRIEALDGTRDNAIQQHANTRFAPESRSSEQRAKVASEPEQTTKKECTPADNVTEDKPEVEPVSSSLPEQGDTVDEEASQTEEVAADTEKELLQTKSAEAARPVENPEEWDWRVCPSLFGCPCPMMP